MTLAKKSIYLLYENSEVKEDVHNFLSPYYEIKSELMDFRVEDKKTKEIHFEVDQRMKAFRFDFLMIQNQNHFELYDSMKRHIAIDFDKDHLNYARKIVAKDPFLRAIGKNRVRVLDVTAGLGIDAVFLAQNGHDVIAIERNPLLFFLISRARIVSEKLQRLPVSFHFNSAVDFITQSATFDCIYYDPMFPDKAKTALPKQEMVLFRQLVGNDNDSEAVLESLLKAKTRVVVKRPISAPSILMKPNNSFESKLIRFDIYEGK